MAMYLLYSATYSQVPLSSVIDTRIKEQQVDQQETSHFGTGPPFKKVYWTQIFQN